MSRFVDRGAIIAAYVGIGMAVTIAMSFLLIIPIEWVVWVLTIPAGLLIGYYANQRSNRRAGPWSRILANGVFAAFVTGLTTAAMLLLVKGLFFFADDGYRDAGQGGRIDCAVGADCVYQRYVAAGRGPELEAAGITDAASFTRFYWGEQFSTAGTIIFLTTLGGLGGAALYGVFRPKPVDGAAAAAATTGTSGTAANAGIGAATTPFVDLMLPFARQMIQEQGAFVPFAATMDAGGRVALTGGIVGVDDPVRQPPAEVLSLLEGALRAQASTGAIVASGLCYDVASDAVDPGAAIVLEMEQAGQRPVRLTQAYSRGSGTDVWFGEPVSAAGRDRIFGGAGAA